MKKLNLLSLMLILAAFHIPNTHAADYDSLHGSSNLTLLKAACPLAWERVDRAIAPNENSPKPTAVPWANAADKAKFMEFQRNYILPQTKYGARDKESVSKDVITVLSECMKRHNFVVRDEFNKTIGKLPSLREMPNMAAIMQILMRYMED